MLVSSELLQTFDAYLFSLYSPLHPPFGEGSTAALHEARLYGDNLSFYKLSFASANMFTEAFLSIMSGYYGTGRDCFLAKA